jgi:hypothetical protein
MVNYGPVQFGYAISLIRNNTSTTSRSNYYKKIKPPQEGFVVFNAVFDPEAPFGQSSRPRAEPKGVARRRLSTFRRAHGYRLFDQLRTCRTLFTHFCSKRFWVKKVRLQLATAALAAECFFIAVPFREPQCLSTLNGDEKWK